VDEELEELACLDAVEEEEDVGRSLEGDETVVSAGDSLVRATDFCDAETEASVRLTSPTESAPSSAGSSSTDAASATASAVETDSEEVSAAVVSEAEPADSPENWGSV
jgi:hypothetical protein